MLDNNAQAVSQQSPHCDSVKSPHDFYCRDNETWKELAESMAAELELKLLEELGKKSAVREEARDLLHPFELAARLKPFADQPKQLAELEKLLRELDRTINTCPQTCLAYFNMARTSALSVRRNPTIRFEKICAKVDSRFSYVCDRQTNLTPCLPSQRPLHQSFE